MRMRQIHRWTSIVFTVTVIANFVAIALGGGAPPLWITYSPLPPLFLLLFTGLYLFILPYRSRSRMRGQTPLVRGVRLLRSWGQTP